MAGVKNFIIVLLILVLAVLGLNFWTGWAKSPNLKFLLIVITATTTFFLGWSFIRLYSRANAREARASETGFMAGTFHELVSKLKEKEAELQRLRKMAEERASLLEISSENILESVSSGVISLDGGLRVTKANGRAEKILEFRREEALGGPAESILSGPILDSLEKNEVVERGETNLRTRSGKALWLGFSISPLLDSGGKGIGQILVFTDLTGLKRLERQAELRKRLSSLGELSAGMAHELRNPMGVIAGYSKMLSKKAPEELRPVADAIEKEIAAMDSIINGFLSFARPREPAPAPVRMEPFLRALAESALPEGGGIRVEFSFNGPEIIRADQVLLRQAFTNLIQNAFQAMPEGGTLAVSTALSDEFVVIKFRDSGPGIPEEIRDKIFLPFYTTKEGGTGLGLAITHSIVQSHGGAISVESSDAGTMFSVKLPVG